MAGRRKDDTPQCVFPNGSSGGPDTTALVNEVDKRQLVVLRDNRMYVGVLRSFDQFANIVLEHCHERIYVGSSYGDVPVGLFIIRGENVMLLGRLDPEREEQLDEQFKIPMEEIVRMRQEQNAAPGEAEIIRKHQVEFAEY